MDISTIPLSGVAIDSRKVKPGDVFVAIRGYVTDGHNYIKQAEASGAAYIVCEEQVEGIQIPQIVVEDSRQACADLACRLYDYPADKMKIIGVTGTNGKTTVTHLIKRMIEESGKKVGLIGTNYNLIGDEKIEAHRTTPEAVELQGLLREMLDKGCEYVVMEVASHALYLKRVAGITFEAGAFTNLTQDHLDFHNTMDEYFEAKASMFNQTRHKIINIDDDYAARLSEGAFTISATDSAADMYACDVEFTSVGMKFNLNYKGEKKSVSAPLVGKFNLSNLLVAFGVSVTLGVDVDSAIKAIAGFEGVCGRMELIPTNRDFTIVIDYAHTPDGLKNALIALKTEGHRLVVVYGCGGDRDRTKRPIMGGIAAEYADFSVITSDNPRTEEPSAIIDDILEGVEKTSHMVVIPNRREAIEYAIKNAWAKDIILLAGKGHEDYQILADKTIHFDEHEIIDEILSGK
ncbi:MAG: UDP-N-acetylmuramoyl-L-alanyl-D-glutamate--2,6-diaminopimelate ligase [Clostridiales bacterium]|jgi:UDP-N-acetylmuramoyl-L-alanyl-D-glutamate--2,6-diaminopimelate ligase|nr:UDP-N-acetylmuramoyl-L-alanyl-D-glutamate--2,6-diaminopimelate ligase [Clostridiales bacterium]